MPLPKVYMLDSFHPAAAEVLESSELVDTIKRDDPRRNSWHSDAVGIIIRSETTLTASDYQKAKSLKYVVKQGVGVDNIDLKSAKEHGIAVHNTPGVNSETVAEYSLAMGLSLARRIPAYDRKILAGEAITRNASLGLSLYRKTVGIIGMGNIGRFAALKWRGACEATIIGYDPVAPSDIWDGIPHTRVQTVEELVKASDVITLHVPLLPTTRDLIGEKEFAMMKPDTVLINAARGGVLDEKATLKALQEGKIWGAALDAMEVEPPTREVYGEFLNTGRCIITPHMGGSTTANQANSAIAVAKTLLALVRGDTDITGKVV